LTPNLLRRLRVPGLALALAITVFLGLKASSVGVERDNQSLRSSDAVELRNYDEFKAAFGNDDDILVAIGHPRLLTADGLTLLADLTTRIEAMDGVGDAWSLIDAEEIVAGEAGAEPRPLLPPPYDVVGIEARAAAALDRNPDFTGWLVSPDRLAAGIVVEIEDRPADSIYRSALVASLRKLAPLVAARGGEFHLTGVPVQKIDVSDYVDRDQRVLLPAAVVVLGLTLALFFRHISGVVVPLAAAGVTVVWTIGAYSLAGLSVNAITALLPPVMLVVAIATTIHVYDAWLAGHTPALSKGEHAPPPAAGFDRAVLAVRAVFVPALLCAVTTSQGFLSLVFGSDLPAVRQFGVFAAFGTVVAFVTSVTLVPAALGAMKPPPHRASDEHGWTLRFLDATSSLATRRPWTVIVVFGAITIALAAGIPRIRSNTDLVGFLKPDAPLRIDTAWIDQHLTGTLPFDFVVRRADGRPVPTPDSLRRLEAFEASIRARDHVAGVTSALALVRQVNRAETGGTALTLPDDAGRLQGQLDLLDESGHSLVRRFATPGMTALRVSVRLRSVGTAESAPLVAAIGEDAARILGPDFVVVPVGSLWMVVHDSENLVRQQVTSFGSAIVLVVAAIGLLLRSWTFTLVALIPNVMPIVWTGGLMGYAGVELSTGTAMIASAVLGLVVDDTIHYLSYYQRVHRGEADGDATEAIRRTSRAVGAPVTAASTSLVLGFWVGAVGSFLPTVYFSLLTGLTMITGVVCDLLVLPASLVLLDRAGRRSRKGPGALPAC